MKEVFNKKNKGIVISEITISKNEYNLEYSVLEAYFDEEGFLETDRLLELKKENYEQFIKHLKDKGFQKNK
ncbi:MAG: hypothetical protein ACRC0V_10825 [Fusobacteriaceae bacterium]